MILVFDRREALGPSPGTHALVVGISNYPHLSGGTAATDQAPGGLHSLTIGARSAYVFQTWLSENADRLAAPLKTLRVMLAPSEQELSDVPKLAELQAPCAVGDVLTTAYEWRKDAQQSRNDATIFYFCGNGFEARPSDPAIVFADFGAEGGTKLRGAVSVNNIVRGMAPSPLLPDVARSQLYFFDAGRRMLPHLDEDAYFGMTRMFDIGRVQLDDRRLALCHPTSPGASAFGGKGGITYFLVALKQCLEGRAAVPAPRSGDLDPPRWQVTIDSLTKALPDALQEATENTRGAAQRPQTASLSGDIVIVKLEGPPAVPIRIEIEPPEAAEGAQIEILDIRAQRVDVKESRRLRGRVDFRLPAGLYQVRVSFPVPDGAAAAPTVPFLVSVEPPRSLWKVAVPVPPVLS